MTMKECTKCKGTGLYVGFAEPAGCAVICRDCKGVGGVTDGRPGPEYTGRKKRDGVERVFVDGGLWMTRQELDARDNSIPVSAFYAQVKADGYSGEGLSGKFRSIDDE